MLFRKALQLRHILFVTHDKTYYYAKRKTFKQNATINQQVFESLGEALHFLGNRKKYEIILSDINYIQEEITLSKVLSESKYVRMILDDKIEKDPAVTEKIYYHYDVIETSSTLNHVVYNVFGFAYTEFMTLMKMIKAPQAVESITGSAHLFYTYLKQTQHLKSPFIGMYRFKERDIMVVSDGKRLLFSRSHQSPDAEDDLRALHYAIARYRALQFTLFIGGDFNESFFEAQEIEVTPLPAVPDKTPIFFEAGDHLNQKYNFFPDFLKRQKVMNLFQQWFFNLTAVVMLGFFIHFVSVGLSYKKERVQYDKTFKIYQETLHDLELISDLKIEQLMQFQKLLYHGSLKELSRWMHALEPLLCQLELKNFSWHYYPKKESFELLLEQNFTSLASMDQFFEQYKAIKADLMHSIPQLQLTLENDFQTKKMSLMIRLIEKNRSKREQL